METIVLTIITLIQTVLSDTGATSTVITKIISSLETIVPIIAGVAPAMLADIKNIVSDLRANTETPVQLMTNLDAIDAAADSALDSAAKNAGLST